MCPRATLVMQSCFAEHGTAEDARANGELREEPEMGDAHDLLGDSDSDAGGALADVRLVDAKLRYGPVPEGKSNRFGVIITLLGTKPKGFTLRQLSLFLEGDTLWDGLPGPVAWIIRNSFMPLRLAPDYMDVAGTLNAAATQALDVLARHHSLTLHAATTQPLDILAQHYSLHPPSHTQLVQPTV